MREILFAGKEKTTGNWAVGFFVSYEDEAYIFEPSEVRKGIDIGGYLDCCQMTEVRPETVCQFTGMYDKNGRKIFEGDIVRTKFGRLCIVQWFSSPMHSCWDLKAIETTANLAFTRPPYTDIYKKDNLEIVGNIYDNPELLEEKE